MSAAVYPGFVRAGALGVFGTLGALVREPAFAVCVLVWVLAFPTQPPLELAHARQCAVRRGAPRAGAQQFNFITGG
jgi:hypothetical protein